MIEKVIWSEGLFMTPQHLQKNDEYYESLILSRMNVLDTESWGIASLSIDLNSLKTGEFIVREVSVVFPCGTFIHTKSGNLGHPSGRSIDSSLSNGNEILEVFLGIPKNRTGGVTLGKDRAEHARYFSHKKDVKDNQEIAEDTQIEFGIPNIKILFGKENSDIYNSIKIAEIVRDQHGTITITSSYIPPVLRIGAAPFIMDSLRQIYALMLEKRKLLVNRNLVKSNKFIEHDSNDIVNLFLLSSISTFIPFVRHVIEFEQSHPRFVYRMLIQLIGAISLHDESEDSLFVPTYNYLNLNAVFENLVERIVLILENISFENDVAIALTARTDGMHHGKIDDSRLLGSTRFFIGVRSTLPQNEVEALLPRYAKIASWNDINHIMSAATSGVPVEFSDRNSSNISAKSGYVYFSINSNNTYWNRIISEKNIAIYLPAPFDPQMTSIEILGTPRGVK